MNSCLYECLVMHNRLEPRRNRFYYRIFMFYLDLDEIDFIAQKRILFSRNRFNVFNFRDSDHLDFTSPAIKKGRPVKENIVSYFAENGIETGDQRIMLLTSVCTMGYQFNPVSFIFLLMSIMIPFVHWCKWEMQLKNKNPTLSGRKTYADIVFTWIHLNTLMFYLL